MAFHVQSCSTILGEGKAPGRACSACRRVPSPDTTLRCRRDSHRASLNHNGRFGFRVTTWHAIACLALESGRDVDQLAEEAFRDLLKKHRRPTTLREALRESVLMLPANDHRPVRRLPP